MKQFFTLHPEVRVINAEAGTVDYIASDETRDCYNEIVRAKGWKFNHFAKNSPFVDSHEYGCIDKLLGSVIDFRVTGNQLIERVQWAIDVPDNKLAQLGWKMTVAGYLKAVSVGFFPMKYASKWGDNVTFAEAVKDLGLTAEQAALVNIIHLEQEQIELSACIIGANPNALAKAHTDGAVKDADLDAVGFTDRDMQALHDLAKSYPDLSPLMRRVADSQLAAIPFRKNAKTQHATPADGSAAAGEARQQKRQKLMREIKRITQKIQS